MAEFREKPKPPFPEQSQPKPGIEARLTPRPQYQAAEYKPAGKLEGKAALITGGDSGIGRAVAVLFAKEGADVAIVYLAEEEGEVRECLLLPGDVTDPAFCQRAVQKTVQRFGKLDILINNAAYQESRESLEE